MPSDITAARHSFWMQLSNQFKAKKLTNPKKHPQWNVLKNQDRGWVFFSLFDIFFVDTLKAVEL